MKKKIVTMKRENEVDGFPEISELLRYTLPETDASRTPWIFPQ